MDALVDAWAGAWACEWVRSVALKGSLWLDAAWEGALVDALVDEWEDA